MSESFSDNELSLAAKAVRKAMLDSLSEEEICQSELPISFEKRMEPLIAKARRKETRRGFAQRCAAAFLVVLLGATTWLSVDTSARASFLKWIKEIDEHNIIYHFFCPNDVAPSLNYAPTWLPAGYTLDYEKEGYHTFLISFSSEESELFFTCSELSENVELSADTEGEIYTASVTVQGLPGDYYEYSQDGEPNDLIWIDETANVVFSLSAPLDKDILLQVAESVQKK